MPESVDIKRYHALDSVRATAMLLGVVYHTLMFRMFLGGGPPGPMGMGGPSRYLQDWLHSFRMPLFFLISGFFGRMMLEKYGTKTYLRKRWFRIGLPMVLGMFTFGPLYVLTRDALSTGPRFGGGPPGAGTFSPGGGGMPAPPPGFVPPPLARFDEDTDGSLSDTEWQKARKELDQMFGGGGPGGDPPAGAGPGGPPPGFGPGGGGPPGFGPGGGGPPGFGPGGGGPPRGMRPGGPMPGPFGGGAGFSQFLFGSNSRLFQLNHLWFLWYLLIFATVAPWVARVLGWALLRPDSGAVDRLGDRLLRSGLAPVALGVVSVPALLAVPGMFGWYLGLPGSIFRAFPDFLLHLDPDMGFFFLFFLAGWWLHREREALPSLARYWLVDLLVGLATFAAATWLNDHYSRRPDVPYYAFIRVAGYALYCLSSAATGFAFLGFFQKYLERQSPAGRYLADTALWVYLIHQPLVIVGLACLVPYRLPWWALTSAVSVFSVAAALLLYEALVRPTALIYLFGPASSRRVGPSQPRPESQALVAG